MEEKKKYPGLDGLRAYSALGIVLWHVFLNGDYKISIFSNRHLLYPLSNLPYLFMIISAFSMCCGYYTRIKVGSITPNQFYLRRYTRILPFYTLLVLLEVVAERSPRLLLESFMNLTLLFGLLPNANIEVSKVSWALGIIFVFYLLFPWVVFLFDNKRRGWITFLISFGVMVSGVIYWFRPPYVVEDYMGRNNILYCLPFFTLGMLLFLYKESISNMLSKCPVVMIGMILAGLVGLSIIQKDMNELLAQTGLLIVCGLLLTIGFCCSGIILNNNFTHFFSGISFEIYLSHMAAYRVLEKMKIVQRMGSGVIGLLIVFVLTTGFTVIAIIIYRYLLQLIQRYIRKV